MRYRPGVPSTLFRGGTIWTGVNGQATDALLIVDGAVRALGEAAHQQAQGAEDVDLGGGFLMPSFGDGHAHPLPGGLEAVGPQVRACKSVDEIVAEVKSFAAEHPDDEFPDEDRSFPEARCTGWAGDRRDRRRNFGHANTSSKTRLSACGVGIFMSLPMVAAT